MHYVKWSLIALLVLLVFAFFHYTLPQRDIVRIVNTYEERQDFGWNGIFWAEPSSGTTGLPNRDVLFIQTIRANGKPMVYRNEDTGWGWPPYFKFDTANLQTEAADSISNRDNPEWVAITHYGWRNELISIFPNAVSIRPVEGPDVTFFPWANTVILTILAGLLVLAWRMWMQFRERMIDPLVEDVSDTIDRVDARADAARGRFRRWLDTWRGKPRR
ncbi:MAG: DUF1523 family protein [Rhodobacteraceae bacterium]|nr:DUF1523 family protein [Paracoccaceae bacterium]